MSVFPLFPHEFCRGNARNDRVARLCPLFPVFPQKKDKGEVQSSFRHVMGCREVVA